MDGLKETSLSPGASTKRKRDEDDAAEVTLKRPAPMASMSHDAPNLSFIESAVEAAAAAAQNAAAQSAAQDELRDGLRVLQQVTDGVHSHSHTPDAATVASTTAAAALTMYPTLHVPPTTEQQFAAAAAAEAAAAEAASAYPEVGPDGLLRDGQRKPATGTPEWHKQRKDNHKEVERRRRETINEGINELAKIVPQCEKNKGSILQKAVQFIQQLKANEQSHIEKWTLEKLLTEQALTELGQSTEKLKAECARLYREVETYKRLCQSAGIELPPTKESAPAV